MSRNDSEALIKLKEFSPDYLLDKQHLAEIFAVDDRTIQRRVRSFLLPPAAFGKASDKRWHAGQVVAWLERLMQRTFEAASEQVKRLQSL